MDVLLQVGASFGYHRDEHDRDARRHSKLTFTVLVKITEDPVAAGKTRSSMIVMSPEVDGSPATSTKNDAKVQCYPAPAGSAVVIRAHDLHASVECPRPLGVVIKQVFFLYEVDDDADESPDEVRARHARYTLEGLEVKGSDVATVNTRGGGAGLGLFLMGAVARHACLGVYTGDMTCPNNLKKTSKHSVLVSEVEGAPYLLGGKECDVLSHVNEPTHGAVHGFQARVRTPPPCTARSRAHAHYTRETGTDRQPNGPRSLG